MSKIKSFLKWSLLTLTVLIVSVVAFGFWFMSLIATDRTSNAIENTVPQDLSYLTDDVNPSRGKILAVVTSCAVMGNSGKSTGYELTELSRAYYVFKANGFEVDVASPLGGKPPVIIDKDDMGEFDYAFLNDSIAQHKVNHSIAMEKVISEDYEGVYFVGGKGAMFDFPQNLSIQSIVQQYYHSGKIIGAVCHGPAALINVTLNDGSSLLENKTITGFTNTEELFLIPEAASIFPFLLQDKLEESGAHFSDGIMYLENVSKDGSLVTGQNPWSTWTVAETMILQMGFEPKKRDKTAEENTVTILYAYEVKGYSEAKTMMNRMISTEPNSMNKTLLAMHSIVAAMQWDIGKSLNLIRLLSRAKSVQ